MGRKLTANVLVVDDKGEPVLLKAGQDVPADYTDQVGDHCFADQQEDTEPKPARKPRSASA